MFSEFNYQNGNIEYIDNDFSYLYEDMLQVIYPNNHLLDIGWYGSNNGFFIYIIKNSDWQNPIAKFIAKTEDELKLLIPQAIERIVFESSINQTL